MARTLNIEKVLALPTPLTGDTLYLVKNGQGFDFYATDEDGILMPNNPPAISSSDTLHPFFTMGVANG